jgi:hypothetical protein
LAPAAPIVSSAKGDDWLLGFGGDDTLVGAKGDDTLESGNDDQADDTLDGGEGEDFYSFEGDWGDDVITDTANVDDDPFTGNSAIFRIPGFTDPLVVNLISGPTLEATAGTNAVNWSCPTAKDPTCNPDVIAGIYVRTLGNDFLTGNSVANFFDNIENSAEGDGGNDTISAGEGSDDINNGDKSGTDTINGEGGNDDIDNDDENGVDIINGGEGNDVIESYEEDVDEDNVIDTGGDFVNGDEGDDTIDVKDGLGGDTVNCGGGTDTVKFDTGDIISDNCENQNP